MQQQLMLHVWNFCCWEQQLLGTNGHQTMLLCWEPMVVRLHVIVFSKLVSSCTFVSCQLGSMTAG